jgi:hypothetical protein
MAIKDMVEREASRHIRQAAGVQPIAKLNFDVDLIEVGHITVDGPPSNSR